MSAKESPHFSSVQEQGLGAFEPRAASERSCDVKPCIWSWSVDGETLAVGRWSIFQLVVSVRAQ